MFVYVDYGVKKSTPKTFSNGLMGVKSKNFHTQNARKDLPGCRKINKNCKKRMTNLKIYTQ